MDKIRLPSRVYKTLHACFYPKSCVAHQAEIAHAKSHHKQGREITHCAGDNDCGQPSGAFEQSSAAGNGQPIDLTAGEIRDHTHGQHRQDDLGNELQPRFPRAQHTAPPE